MTHLDPKEVEQVCLKLSDYFRLLDTLNQCAPADLDEIADAEFRGALQAVRAALAVDKLPAVSTFDVPLDTLPPPIASEQRGLYAKYRIINLERGEEVYWQAFVLNLEGDQHARWAIREYAASVQQENPSLAADLIAWVERLDESQPLLSKPTPPPLDPERLLTIRARVTTTVSSSVIDEDMTFTNRDDLAQRLERVKVDLARYGIPVEYSIEEITSDGDVIDPERRARGLPDETQGGQSIDDWPDA